MDKWDLKYITAERTARAAAMKLTTDRLAKEKAESFDEKVQDVLTVDSRGEAARLLEDLIATDFVTTDLGYLAEACRQKGYVVKETVPGKYWLVSLPREIRRSSDAVADPSAVESVG